MSGLLRHWAALYPDKLAAADPPNKSALGLGEPRRFTYAQLNAVVDRLAAYLLDAGFQRGQFAGVQLPHVTEALLAVLACWRAGLVPAVAPASWRRREISAVFEHLPVEGAIGFWRPQPGMQSHVLTAGGVRQANLCFAFGFGGDVPEGLGNLDECLFDDPPGPREVQAAPADPPLAEQLALVSFGSHRQTGLAIPRSGVELIASGLATAMSLGLTSGGVLLSPYPVSGVTGLAGFLLPWLITGSTLILHQPFDLKVYRQQIAAERPSFTAFPAALLPEIAVARTSLRVIAPVYTMPPAETAVPPCRRPAPRCTWRRTWANWR